MNRFSGPRRFKVTVLVISQGQLSDLDVDYCASQHVDARCCNDNNPCVFLFVCTLLHAGSSVLQISEHQVCSLDKVPQACEWLLACLQVTLAALPAPPISSRARRS